MRKSKNYGRRLLQLALILVCLSAAVAWAADAETVHAVAEGAGHAVAEAGHEAAAGGHEALVTGPELKDLFWRFVNFAVLVAILVYFGAKPIAASLSGRQSRIKNEIEELNGRRDEAESSYREFETKLAGMEQEIDSIVERALAQAEVEKTKIIEKAEQTATDIKRQAEMTIQNEILEARRRLKNDMADQAAAMAEELIKKNLNETDQVKIIEDYLDKVGAVQ